MAFCTNCGAKVSDGTKFCSSCGQKIELKAQPLAPAQVQPIEQPTQPGASVQGAYTSSYTAPATPPIQRNDPSQSGQQGSFTQNVYAQPAAVPKQKKPVNKKALFIIGGAVLAVILAIVLIAVLSGKGGKSEADDPNLGLYTAISAEMMGIKMDVADLFGKGVTIELKKNGKCAMDVDGAKGNGKWTVEDGVFHVEGSGIECDGTLIKGVMIWENVLDMGVNLTFEKEGGFRSGDTGDVGAAALPGGDPAGEGEATALQKQWNGTWYGCMYVSEATGDFSGIPSDFYDAYMVVDVDGKGKGQFAVYLANVEEAFALANCEAKESGLYAIDGTVAGGVDMYAYNWMFLPMPDYPDQYVMGDIIEDGDSIFDFQLLMKQWGGSWQKEIDSDFAIVPPSVESYNAAIEKGELPPVGFAPIGYEGTAVSSVTTPDAIGKTEGGTDETASEPAYDTSGFHGVVDLEGKGLVELSYPEDQFMQDTERHTIKCQKKKIFFTTIYVYPQGSSSISGSDDFMSVLRASADFADSQVRIGGFPARRVTCIDDYFKEPFVYYLIDTSSANNPDVGGVYIKVNLYDVADYPLVDAIVSTIKVK